MGMVASRDLRNHTAEVLRRVARGEQITVTVNGESAAKLVPVSSYKKRYLSTLELKALLLDGSSAIGPSDESPRIAAKSGSTTVDA